MSTVHLFVGWLRGAAELCCPPAAPLSRWTCSTWASGPGKNRLSLPLSDHRTRYGPPPPSPTCRISPSRIGRCSVPEATTIRSPTSAFIVSSCVCRWIALGWFQHYPKIGCWTDVFGTHLTRLQRSDRPADQI